MHSSTSNFERVIPGSSWRGITVAVVTALFIAVAAWEVYCRSLGYAPTLNNTTDLWAEARRRVQPESIVIIGDSRAWFDTDLGEIQRGLGKRPIQLAQPGSCPYPVLEDLAKDESFHGTIICSILPRIYLAPPGTPPMDRAQKAVQRYHGQTWAQRISHELSIPLESSFAFLKQDDLTLDAMLQELPIPDRPYALVSPPLPPYFCSIDRERRARMVEQCARPGPLRDKVRKRWARLFTPLPPPTYIAPEKFAADMQQAIEARYHDTKACIDKLRARGGKIVFVRFPMSGPLKELEDKITPRGQTWDPLVQQTGVPGIYFEDFPELSSFECPEWSHLSAADSVEFTKRLVPHLRQALQLDAIATNRVTTRDFPAVALMPSR